MSGGDWIDDLTPGERSDWDRFVDQVRRDTISNMESSAFVMSLVPRGDTDVKFALELGLAIMLDKPIMAIVMPGQVISSRLRMVCDEIVVADLDLEEGQRTIAEAIARLTAKG